MNGPPAMTHVAEYLLAEKDPNRVALCSLQGNHSYGELQRAVDAVSRHLLLGSFEKGERVILMAENSLFWAAAYLGTMQAGLVSVPLPASLDPEDLRKILEITGARAAFVHFRLAARHADLFAGMHLVTDRRLPAEAGVAPVDFRELLGGGGSEPGPAAEVGPDDVAALMFTSGSTGTPRGVMVSHRNIMANTDSIIQYLGLTAEDRIMDVLPFHYCFGASLLHTHLRVGGAVVMDSRFLYPEAVLQRMQATECTGFAGVPSHFQILLRESSLSRMTFPRLRYVQQAGGALAPRFIQELREALPQTQVFVMYGQTEATARLSYLPPELLDRKIGSIGKAIPGVRLEVLNESGVPVKPGETGEIVAQGANIAAGYWRAPEDSAAAFRNGKLYTGDLATVDEEGFIYIVDSAKDMIKCGGQRVSGRRLEEQLLAFGELQEAAVTGMTDEILGEAVKAFVVLRGTECGANCDWRQCRAAREQVWRHCKRNLPPPQVPKQIVALPCLPKSGTGKILKSQLSGL